MPLFAALFNSAAAWFAGFFSNVMYTVLTVTWARRAFIAALGVTFFAAIGTCVSSLLSMISTSSLPGRFTMGLGMFIPSNAVAVLACVGSVWLACIVYRLKLNALTW